MRLYKLNVPGAKKWVNLDSVALVEYVPAVGTTPEQLTLTLSFGGEGTPVPDSADIKNIALILGISLT